MSIRKAFFLVSKSLLLAGLVLASGWVFGANKKMIQVKGSDTMINLVQILAEEYMGQNPGTALAVLGGGSGTGVSAMINRTTDICDASRDLNVKEVALAYEKGIKPRRFVIAVDGLSIVVNAKNPLDKLSMPQVGALYRGEIKSWKAVGGPDKAVSLYGRQSNSGTYSFLQEHVLKNKNYSTDMKEMNGNAQIVESIIQDEGGIGYVGVGYVYDQNGKVRQGLKVLNISKDDKSAATSPMEKANIDSGLYPISRGLFQFTDGKPSADVAKFLMFETGPEGQKIVEREGFFVIGAAQKAENDKNLK
jgi:phosphate transport system substrate-binding protein